MIFFSMTYWIKQGDTISDLINENFQTAAWTETMDNRHPEWRMEKSKKEKDTISSNIRSYLLQ